MRTGITSPIQDAVNRRTNWRAAARGQQDQMGSERQGSRTHECLPFISTSDSTGQQNCAAAVSAGSEPLSGSNPGVLVSLSSTTSFNPRMCLTLASRSAEISTPLSLLSLCSKIASLLYSLQSNGRSSDRDRPPTPRMSAYIVSAELTPPLHQELTLQARMLPQAPSTGSR